MRQGGVKSYRLASCAHHTHECLQHPGPGAQTIRWKSNAFQIRPFDYYLDWQAENGSEKPRLLPTQPSRKHPGSQANLGQVIWRLRCIKAIYKRREGGICRTRREQTLPVKVVFIILIHDMSWLCAHSQGWKGTVFSRYNGKNEQYF